MKKLLIILAVALAALASYSAMSTDTAPATIKIADGVTYDSETCTAYVTGKNATIRMKRIEAMAKEIAEASPIDDEKYLNEVKNTLKDDPELLEKELERIEMKKNSLFILSNNKLATDPNYKEYPIKKVVYEN
jgi:hypothetical protein